MLNIILILYKVIAFILFKFCIIQMYYNIYILFSNHVMYIRDTYQSTFCFCQENKNHHIYKYKYNDLNRSSYQDSVYIVKPGDTLFYIAWITGNNCLDLAKKNKIKNIHVLQVNQVLKVHNNTMNLPFFRKLFKKMLLPVYNSCSKFSKLFFFIKKKNVLSVKQDTFFDTNMVNKVSFNEKRTDTIISTDWSWPTNGSIINTFSDTEGGNTGIDISGAFDQPILATTSGQVVYVGNVLKGYGNLVIIKHDNNYLSAYAHNNKILVTEQQHVNIGDQIATMGNSGTDKVKLHFEIRYKGKSINPLHVLP